MALSRSSYKFWTGVTSSLRWTQASSTRPYASASTPKSGAAASSSSPTSPSAASAKLKPALFKPELVIFDKDGTLVCFHTMWTPWCTSLARRMQSVSGRQDLTESLYDVLGYDHGRGKVKIGALAENTHPQIRTMIEDMLQRRVGLTRSEAALVVTESWMDTPEEMEIKTTDPNLRGLFSSLREEGVAVAICTSDSREGTLEFLERQRLADLVDCVVCGDDPESRPKPDPHNARHICRTLGVRPAAAIMVGDTPADTLMGQQAGLGLTVGVLSGVGAESDLADADMIVHDVREVVELIVPPEDAAADSDSDDSGKPRTHQITTRGLAKIAQAGAFWWPPSTGGRGNSGTPLNRRGFATSASARSPAKADEAEYSHVIVGAGSAGCVLANRLTENRH